MRQRSQSDPAADISYKPSVNINIHGRHEYEIGSESTLKRTEFLELGIAASTSFVQLPAPPPDHQPIVSATEQSPQDDDDSHRYNERHAYLSTDHRLHIHQGEDQNFHQHIDEPQPVPLPTKFSANDSSSESSLRCNNSRQYEPSTSARSDGEEFVGAQDSTTDTDINTCGPVSLPSLQPTQRSVTRSPPVPVAPPSATEGSFPMPLPFSVHDDFRTRPLPAPANICDPAAPMLPWQFAPYNGRQATSGHPPMLTPQFHEAAGLSVAVDITIEAGLHKVSYYTL
jgi:hypothetical protein